MDSGIRTRAEAYKHEMKYFKTRLDDPSLLDRAIHTNSWLLAVPVGGKRRGGRLDLDTRERADEAIAELSGIEGFPRLRYQYDESWDDELNERLEYHTVCWGEDEPALPSDDAPESIWLLSDIEHGRYFGYSEAAIRRYIRKNY